MKKPIFSFLLSIFSICSFAQLTPFELSESKNVTATYPQVISYYKNLDQKYEQCKLLTYGQTDIGKPLNLLILSKDKVFDPVLIRKQNKRILLINNGIHPGEPEGIDASMMLARDLLQKNQLPKDVVICILPLYNIDGSLNRGQSRANQNGPESYGFRGNAKNLDLNRDFIKTDSKNSFSFQEIFNIWQPEILLDNHTSNGADYQYVMTLIETQRNKLNPVLSEFMTKTIEPELYSSMKKSGYEMTPYVDHIAETPDSGITAFLEGARFSTGYAALHNTIAFMCETHMLKPFDKRVYATYHLMQNLINVTQKNVSQLGEVKKRADENVKSQKIFPLNWKMDESKFDSVMFKGYQGKHKASDISGLNRLYYDRNAPFEKYIKLYNTYKPILEVEKPLVYIVPQAWQKAVDLLKLNGVAMKALQADTVMEVESYYIGDYKTASKPYEGHYIHSDIKVQSRKQKLMFFKGDFLIYVNQPQNRYIVETLEPQGGDSFFAWNFFDSILGQKEYFSAYVFEDEGAKILSENPELKQKLEEAKKENPDLTKSASAQLNWVYQHSDYYEKSYLRYPVARILSK
ncbi:MAG: M14 family metallopeptidase [Daejeonella sp.]